MRVVRGVVYKWIKLSTLILNHVIVTPLPERVGRLVLLSGRP